MLIDWSVRCETPAGEAGQVRHQRHFVPRRLTARPAESEHPGAEINHNIKKDCLTITEGSRIFHFIYI